MLIEIANEQVITGKTAWVQQVPLHKHARQATEHEQVLDKMTTIPVCFAAVEQRQTQRHMSTS